MADGKESVKRIRGDGLYVKLESNDRILEVTGDGCRITMAKNCGSVRVVGDGCRLKIAHNTGDIMYTGDGGQVSLGPRSSTDNVTYIGDGGRVTFNNDPKKTACRKDNKNGNVKTSVDLTEVMHNLLNERKEAKLLRNTVKPKIYTTIECDERCVKKWIVNPGSVINSFDGAPFKTPSRHTKTKIQVK